VALEGVDIEGEAAHEMGRVSEGSGQLAVDCNTTRSETIVVERSCHCHFDTATHHIAVLVHADRHTGRGRKTALARFLVSKDGKAYPS